ETHTSGWQFPCPIHYGMCFFVQYLSRHRKGSRYMTAIDQPQTLSKDAHGTKTDNNNKVLRTFVSLRFIPPLPSSPLLRYSCLHGFCDTKATLTRVLAPVPSEDILAEPSAYNSGASSSSLPPFPSPPLRCNASKDRNHLYSQKLSTIGVRRLSPKQQHCCGRNTTKPAPAINFASLLLCSERHTQKSW
ncbi:unnamed protein product, partial [Ectocarpus fasciculatus]